MHKSRWSSEFGLYKIYNDKKESNITKFIVIVTTIGIILFTVFYTCIFILKDFHLNEAKSNVTEEYENSTNYITIEPVTEKLTEEEPIPFANYIRGPRPNSFTPIPTTSIFPQISRQGFPRNIQEIIGYISPVSRKKEYTYTTYRSNVIFPTNHDRFYKFKPKNPSDINLMATANLRFAPPSWKDLQTPSPSTPVNLYKEPNFYKEPNIPKEPNVHKEARINQHASKPVTLVFNVFPSPNDPSHEHFYGVPASGNEARLVGREPRKMIIHLNIYAKDSEIASNLGEIGLQTLNGIFGGGRGDNFERD